MSHFTFDQDVHPAAIPSELYLPLPLHSKSNPVRNQRTSRSGKAKTKHRKAVSEGQASLFPSRICQSTQWQNIWPTKRAWIIRKWLIKLFLHGFKLLKKIKFFPLTVLLSQSLRRKIVSPSKHLQTLGSTHFACWVIRERFSKLPSNTNERDDHGKETTKRGTKYMIVNIEQSKPAVNLRSACHPRRLFLSVLITFHMHSKDESN